MDIYTFDENGAHVIHDFRSCMESLEYLNKKNQETIQKLRKENEQLKSEHYKDEELMQLKQKLEKRNADCRRGFVITEEEQKRIDIWKKEHEESDNLYQKHSKHSYTYIFEPTEIVTFGTIRCQCGAEFCFKQE